MGRNSPSAPRTAWRCMPASLPCSAVPASPRRRTGRGASASSCRCSPSWSPAGTSALLLRGWAQGEEPADITHLPRFARWLVATGAVGIVSLAVPINRLDPAGQGVALLAAMAVIAVISVIAVADVVRLLVDMAVIFRAVTLRLSRLAVPIAAFSSDLGAAGGDLRLPLPDLGRALERGAVPWAGGADPYRLLGCASLQRRDAVLGRLWRHPAGG